ncbi:MAG: hypothetical protein COV02_01700 [Candidatus Terrybacteria bacterium CG10_big_fil_rev_8_21_14_0_10_41_10]|uniref:ABC transporter substrate-binding protein n=1 Tax=Candidatus Terrybacteria bacterium CG10_big_fil_rev_8_21_14_0_10_41_10 TaxID=1975026 RepID=A0A2M8LAF5_9BACT|nr:MAG: hypothetical protein COV02_01700 [Candidatus Terrybacteria bacterium CG10_big_fil_rev_8_21_14_0_10_41_10]
MKGISVFGAIIIVIFVAAALIAVLMFAGFLPGYKGKKGSSSKVDKTDLVLWGTFAKNEMNSALASINKDRQAPIKINYVQKSSKSYQNDLVDALASNKGPDMIIVSQDMLLKNQDRFFAIPFTAYPERDFKDNFSDIAEVLLNTKSKSVRGLPFMIDPLVMYWNKNLFSSSGISGSPEYWDEFLEYTKALTEKNERGNISQAGAAMGEFSNVNNAKDIFSTLVLQTGNPIVDSKTLKTTMGDGKNYSAKATENAVNFFNEFSNSNKLNYSWNRSLPSSQDMFAGGSLAMYFGFASEYESIKKKNSHLGFDVALMPQVREGSVRTSFGRLYSIVVLNDSNKKQSALNAAVSMTSSGTLDGFSSYLRLAPARRSALTQNASDSYFSLLYKAAIMARSWLEPDSDKINDIFKDMTSTAASGAAPASEAVRVAERKINDILEKMLK